MRFSRIGARDDTVIMELQLLQINRSPPHNVDCWVTTGVLDDVEPDKDDVYFLLEAFIFVN